MPGEYSTVVVAENGDEIIGTWVSTDIPHMEGMWVRPDYRKQKIAFNVILTMKQALTDIGLGAVMCCVDNPVNAKMLVGLGMTKLPVDIYVWKVQEPLCPQQL